VQGPSTGKERRFAEGGLRIGFFWPFGQTTHVVSGALAGRNPDLLDPSLTMELARAIEDSGFDFIFIADSWWSTAGDVGHRSPMYDPSLAATLVATATRHAGIITTIQGLLHSPAYVARIGAGLDHLSGGRWAWNIVTGSTPEGEGLFGVDHIDHDLRYDMAEEMLAAVRAIWSSDPREAVSFEGRFYRFRGALMPPRPLQRPCPLLVSASSSAYGQRFAARCCDYLFVNPAPEASALRAASERMKAIAVEAGRSAGDVAVLTSPLVILRDSRAAAQAEYEWIMEHADLEATRRLMAHRLAGLSDEAGRELLLQEARGLRHIPLVGTPEDVAGQIADLYRASGIGGLMMSFPFWAPDEVRRFAAVSRLLQADGVWQPPERRGWGW
jgi:FMNH2-dependent dimethyl sulfone monooxygenase